ncbi:MAG: hypothetical protein BA862_01020 [Desulfobulbaceae bacterium S3730MH12]|nr:MAG: hypothetical protein BA866_09455 [Desulfobulbaceae bacterium S5133MH15]OEU54263.1 MAG: hypothetical protein BA862_01020 [Desulfobulbaceae bacterium S3730MH12]OEU83093.1 MAG: hypothetical protein BA873_00765 [Desulfobulbaceae bacterium C00003063]
MSDEDKKVTIETGDAGKGTTELSENANTEEMEERALSVFSSDRNEDIVALVFCLITTFLVLVFTKWMV